MPIKKCQREKRKGFKYGNSGKCYIGKDAKKKAVKQGIAIRLSKKQTKRRNK